jgi:hypothetical protein
VSTFYYRAPQREEPRYCLENFVKRDMAFRLFRHIRNPVVPAPGPLIALTPTQASAKLAAGTTIILPDKVTTWNKTTGLTWAQAAQLTWDDLSHFTWSEL